MPRLALATGYLAAPPRPTPLAMRRPSRRQLRQSSHPVASQGLTKFSDSTTRRSTRTNLSCWQPGHCKLAHCKPPINFPAADRLLHFRKPQHWLTPARRFAPAWVRRCHNRHWHRPTLKSHRQSHRSFRKLRSHSQLPHWDQLPHWELDFHSLLGTRAAKSPWLASCAATPHPTRFTERETCTPTM